MLRLIWTLAADAGAGGRVAECHVAAGLEQPLRRLVQPPASLTPAWIASQTVNPAARWLPWPVSPCCRLLSVLPPALPRRLAPPALSPVFILLRSAPHSNKSTQDQPRPAPSCRPAKSSPQSPSPATPSFGSKTPPRATLLAPTTPRCRRLQGACKTPRFRRPRRARKGRVRQGRCTRLRPAGGSPLDGAFSRLYHASDGH